MSTAKTLTRNVLLLALSATALAGCSTLRPTQKAFAPDEYDQRHPIALTNSTTHIDVFATGSHLDRRQHRDVVEFARDYVKNGSGGMTIVVPRGAMHAGQQGVTASIRQALTEGGAGAHLRFSSYDTDPNLGAAPVRLSFTKLQASVKSKCGIWPSDIAGSKDLETWHNRPYHNLGCSYQTMIAAQVADPVDLVRPRAEGPVDVGKRTKDIEDFRKGTDPSTQWRKDDAKVSEAAK